MSTDELSFFYKKSDQAYYKVWIAAINPKEFDRLMRVDNCELISVSSICDKILLKLNVEAKQLLSADSENDKPMPSYLVASQLLIGLIHVYEQQVKFLYDLAVGCTLPTRFLIEDKNNISEEESSSPNASSPKKPLKRKSTAKVRVKKRKIAFVMESSDEPEEDIETQNNMMLELLRSAFVANNADISIQENEPIQDLEANEINIPTVVFDAQLNVPEQSHFDIAALQDDLMSTLNQEVSVDATPLDTIEPERRQSSDKSYSGRIYEEAADVQRPVAVPDASSMYYETDISPMELEDLEERNVPSRKRKRKQPFKDSIIHLTINVKQNVRTAATTQRHLTSKDDYVSKVSCLNSLSRKMFETPSHSIFSDSMSRQFNSRSMSDKLAKSFNRMTITKTETANDDIVQVVSSNQKNCNEAIGMPKPTETLIPPHSENSIPGTVLQCDETELSLRLNEISIAACMTQPTTPAEADDQLSNQLIVELPSINPEQMNIELSPAVREVLLSTEITNQYSRCVTDSQKLFVSRSRQNKLDWGTEGVLRKLISLWNDGIYPIGMNEILQSNKRRISAATAFFSVIELNSARVGLINITKCPNSNIIFDIIKSPKLIELQQMV